eukprot:COSAG02_NODE_1017_length_15184_cov_3.911966_8_plen_602_part_00
MNGMVFSLDGASSQADRVPSLPLMRRFASVYAHELEATPDDSPLVDADQVSQLFDEVLDRDPAARAEGLERLLTVLWLSIPSDDYIGEDGCREPGPLLHAHLHTVIRWSCTAPFEDIRVSLSEFLDQLRSVHVHLEADAQVEAVSAFMTTDEVVKIDTSDAETRNQLEALFLSEGRISHLMRVMVIHPRYQSCFDVAINYLLRESGPLPRAWRSYIGIMASAQHSCGYIVHRLEIEFLDVGGDESWLTDGLSAAPPKLALLVELNAILARQPWAVDAEHIAKLTGGGDAWTHAEVAHAIILMSAFHALCSFVLGCGLGPELDFRDRASRAHLRMSLAPDPELAVYSTTTSDSAGTVKLIDQLRSGPQDKEEEGNGDRDETDEVEGDEQFDREGQEEQLDSSAQDADHLVAEESTEGEGGYESTAGLPPPINAAEATPRTNMTAEPSADQAVLLADSAAPAIDQPPVQLPQLEPEPEPELRPQQEQKQELELAPQLGGDGNEDAEDAYSYLLSDDERAKYCIRNGEVDGFEYVDFDMHSDSNLDLNENSWDELGYSMVSKYVDDEAAKLLDEEFRAAQTVSDRRVGFAEEDIDTEPYRLAIW